MESRSRSLGCPGKETLVTWLNGEIRATYPKSGVVIMNGLKNPEIPLLASYKEDLDTEFWEAFPRAELPKEATTRVNVGAMKKHIESCRGKMSQSETRRAERVIRDLEKGADACQSVQLPPLCTANAQSAYENGALLTDTIATWVKKGFVAGPFETPPMAGFRANPLAVIVKNGKVRPILNMSGPKGKSFNDNVDRSKLERLQYIWVLQDSLALRSKKLEWEPSSQSLICRMHTNLFLLKQRILGFKDSVGWEDILWKHNSLLGECLCLQTSTN